MQIKYILFLTSLCISAYAKDDCQELGALLKSSMDDCKINSNGEMIELEYNTYNKETTEEAYKKALSYPTLKKLSFYDQYADCKQLSYGLSNLKNLEELHIRSFRGNLVPNTLKGLSSLKKFSYDTGDYNGDFTNQNLQELGTLTNLESLSFSFTSLGDFLKEDLTPLQNLNKVTSLTLHCNGKAGMDVKGCLANLKNLKELAITYDVKNQSDVNAVTSYTNLEKLTIEFRKGQINCDNMKNLTKLHTLDLKIRDVSEVPNCVYSIPNLKKLTYNGKDIPLQNGGNTTTGNNADQTTGNNANQTTGNNANQTPANNTVGNNVDQVAGNNADPAAGNNANQITGNNIGQTVGNNINNGNTTTTDSNNDLDVDSGAGSTIVHAINYLPVIALIFKMLL